MINIQNKTLCCGCSACAQCCPKHSITMAADEEGFLYPQVHKDTCIDCGLCEKVCHELHPFATREPLKVMAAINKDDEVRMASSSGGMFFLLAQQVINAGGVVFGAKYDSDWQVFITYASTMEEVKAFMGSKYVQARTEDSYIDCEKFLKSGRKVLYSGSPCQVAGLKHFLRREYDNLITVDFVCHGMPSPKVWGRYLSEIVASVRLLANEKSSKGRKLWKKTCFDISYDKSERKVSLSVVFNKSHYMNAFLHDMILRPSCYDCKAKCGRSRSDITIADYWGIQIEHPEMYDDKGTSLLIVNTDRGAQCLPLEQCRLLESKLERTKKYNGGLASRISVHHCRKKFFKRLDGTKSVNRLIDRTVFAPTDGLKAHIYFILKKYYYKFLTWRHNVKVWMKSPYCQVSKQNNSVKQEKKKFEALIRDAKPILENGKITDVQFRSKIKGWQNYHMTITIKGD